MSSSIPQGTYDEPVPTGEPPPPNLGTGLFTVENQRFPHTRYTIKCTYHFKSGKIACPVGGPVGTTPQPVIFDCFSPISTKTVSWTATRVGARPICPSPDQVESNLIALENWVEPDTPDILPDAQNHEFSISGVFVFQCLQPMTTVTGFKAAAPPYENIPPGLSTYIGSDFSTAILANG